ncbi:MAG: type II secretion system F family protein [Nanobdellota archaeon]
MNFEKQVLGSLAQVVPVKVRKKYNLSLRYSGLEVSAEKRIGYIVLVFICLFFLVLPFLFILPGVFVLITIASYLLILPSLLMIDYLFIYFKIEDRRERIENVLPDFLHLISSNLRAGLTPFQAIKSSARDEFGPLKDEIEIATTKALGSNSFESALLQIKERIDSNLVDRVVNLFITSLYSGSHMAELMEETAHDMAETKGLKKDLTTGTKTYTMFILFTVIIGSPLLFAISLQFITMIEGMNASSAGSSSFDLGLMGGQIPVSSSFIFWLAIALLVSTSIFSSILMGVIKEGNKTYGLRYAPIIGVVAVVIFFIARSLVGNLF